MMIWGEMCVLSLICSDISVCRFCLVRYVIICFSLLFSNCSTFMFVFSEVLFCFLYILFFIVFILFRVLFLLMFCLFPIFVQVY